MSNMNILEMYQDVKRLNMLQYEECKAKALEQVHKKIGDKPSRANFAREHGEILEPLDYVLIVVFVAAFVVSTLHIWDFSRVQAAGAYTKIQDIGLQIGGLIVGGDVYSALHQLGFMLLAESAMLVFFTRWTLHRNRANLGGLEGMARLVTWLWGDFQGAVSLILGAAAFLFVLHVNLQSGLFPLMAILPPAVLLGVGFRLESITAEVLERKAEIDQRYTEALESWEAAQDDPTQHTDYQRLVRTAIFEKLASLKANDFLRDAPPALKQYAVYREMQRETVFNQAADFSGLEPNPTHAPASNGNGAYPSSQRLAE